MNSFACAGAEKLVMDLSRAVAGRCEYVGVAALYRLGDGMEQQLRKGLEDADIHTYILDKRAAKDRMKAVGKLRSLVREQNIRLIHAHCSIPMLIGKMAGLLTGIPVVCTIHSTRGYSVRREKLTGWMSRSYVSIGAAAEDYMTGELKIPRWKISRIYNAVDGARFAPGKKCDGFWQECGLDPGLPVFVNVGRVVELKNQMCILRAVKRCADAGNPVQCAILGMYEPDSPVYLDMIRYLEEHSLQKYVRFLGQRQNVADFLVNADCFVLTSRYEGLSVSFLEAVFCGLPVIASQMPFVEELNALAPCAAVIGQDDHEALARLLLEKGYKAPTAQTVALFRSHFSLETCADRHARLYGRLLQK